MSVLVVAAGLTAGIAAIVRGWVPWWQRRKVMRPTLWGYGTLVAVAGALLFLGLFGTRHLADIPVGMTGLVALIVGMTMQLSATGRPGPC